MFRSREVVNYSVYLHPVTNKYFKSSSYRLKRGVDIQATIVMCSCVTSASCWAYSLVCPGIPSTSITADQAPKYTTELWKTYDKETRKVVEHSLCDELWSDFIIYITGSHSNELEVQVPGGQLGTI